MATYFFHEETLPTGEHGKVKLIRYYYDDISAEILTRSFFLFPATAGKEFLDNERVPFADLRPDLKAHLIRFLFRRDQAAMRAAS
ncbi:hypothetical protein [Nitrospira moscoviensis]|uniref:Uncharacterized protein n=1 Tax=Nitrospira moscoviensis TaxID=42253 RepID=A0A0K2GF91_NITMO|nr:hypothetical protein [Nitrospira moscoviensis]ALA59621.1 hypothetical protein NITMOv2_3224 [Nitrospira moscoviensis]